MKATNTKQRTAAAVDYAERRAVTADILRRITRRLRENDREQKDTPKHWTHGCTLVDVNKDLAYVLARLGDMSAVKDMNLEY